MRVKSSKSKAVKKNSKDNSRKRDASRNLESKYSKFNHERKRRSGHQLRVAKAKLSAAKAFSDYPTVPETAAGSDAIERRHAKNGARTKSKQDLRKDGTRASAEQMSEKSGDGKDNIVVSEKNTPGCIIL